MARRAPARATQEQECRARRMRRAALVDPAARRRQLEDARAEVEARAEARAIRRLREGLDGMTRDGWGVIRRRLAAAILGAGLLGRR